MSSHKLIKIYWGKEKWPSGALTRAFSVCVCVSLYSVSSILQPTSPKYEFRLLCVCFFSSPLFLNAHAGLNCKQTVPVLKLYPVVLLAHMLFWRSIEILWRCRNVTFSTIFSLWTRWANSPLQPCGAANSQKFKTPANSCPQLSLKTCICLGHMFQMRFLSVLEVSSCQIVDERHTLKGGESEIVTYLHF